MTVLSAQILLDGDRLGYQTEDLSTWEIGIKGGPGYRSKDRFESNLQNFTSTFQPGIFSNTDTFGFREQTFTEFVVRSEFAENQRFGFVIGNLNFHRAGIQEFTSDGYITELNFQIATTYVIFTYHYLWNLNKKWAIEGGLGFGGNQTSWGANGYSTNGIEYFPQDGNLRGNGISFRMEAGFNYRVNENFTLQLGLMWGIHSVPSFSGTWNGNIATFYIREDGKTTPLTESRAVDTIVLTNQFTRALDMNASHAGLYFSALLRFSY